MFQDIRYALRGLRKRPLFTLVAVSVLGLGIGINTAVFTVTDAILLRPLPYQDPDQLVEVQAFNDDSVGLPFLPSEAGLRWVEEADFFQRSTAYAQRSFVFAAANGPQAVQGLGIAPGFFETLGVAPQLGRVPMADDAEPGAQAVAVLDHAFWKRDLGSDPEVIGRVVLLDDMRVSVIGVMPANFHFPKLGRGLVFVGLQGRKWPDGESLDRVNLLARSPGGRAVEQLQARADVFAKGIAEAGLSMRGFPKVRLHPLGQFRANDDVKHALWLLLAGSSIILVIAVFNVANLLLVRGLGRGRELAIRRAVGATSGRLTRLLLAESFLLAQFGCLAALLLALIGVDVLAKMVPSDVQFFAVHSFGIDSRALLHVVILSQGVALLLGVLSIAKAVLRNERGLVLRQGSATARRGWLRSALVVGEVALSLALLAGAGLVIRSFVTLLRVDSGFDPSHLAFVTVGLSPKHYPDEARCGDFLQQLRNEAAALPGVEEVSLTSGLPPNTGFAYNVAIQAEGHEVRASGQPFLLPQTSIEPNALRLLRTPIIEGTGFDADEDTAANRVIIDRDLARFLWPDSSAVGRRFRIGDGRPWLTVAGVIRDLKLMGPDDRQGRFDLLYPYQGSWSAYDTLAIRTVVPVQTILPEVRAIVFRLDPHQPIYRLTSAEEALAESTQKPRFLLVLMSVFAVLALVLAALGLYGVLSFLVGQRRREIGIRLALGARPSAVRRLVLKDGMRLALIGCLLGTALALAFTRLLGSLLFKTDATDPWTFTTVVAAMLATAYLSCRLPARRATDVDPLEVLRAE